MNTDPTTIIKNTLDAIDYASDKEVYSYNFLNLCQKLAIADLISNLSEEKKEQFNQAVTGNKPPEEVKKAFSEFFTGEEYQQALKNASDVLYVGFLQSVLPTLSEGQAKKLDETLISVTPSL